MKKPVVIVLILLGAAVLVFLYFNLRQDRYEWDESYSSKSDQPFGTKYTQEVLKSFASGGFIHNTKKPLEVLLDSAFSATPSTYVSIDYMWEDDSVGGEALQKYIAAGNDAFIICRFMPQRLLSNVYQAECAKNLQFNYVSKNTVEVNFFHPYFATPAPRAFTHEIKGESTDYAWEHLDRKVLCDSAYSVVPLGFFKPDHVNFFKIPHGKGNLYIHTNPILFTNFYIVKESGADYVASVFSHSTHRKIIWDEYRNPFSFNRGPNSYKNPLYYMLEQPALRYAWWLLIVLALLYVVFAAKRQQRFIPVVEKKTNTSLAFLKMISSLHFRSGNNGEMARKKMRFFLHTVRTRYGLHTHTIDQLFIEKLAAKSQVSQAEVEVIFQQYKIINNFQEIDSAPLVNLYNAIQNFYNKAK
ncbi:MAG: hypothetical protein JNK18_02910 [Cyclobacteriaceae bacterium]|nr:hypothetical protein [Cyclobacteriaceae bacterium]